MQKKASFTRSSIAIYILLLCWYYIQGSISDGNTNIITTYLPMANNWTELQVTAPLTAAGLLACIFFFISGGMLNKVGIKKWSLSCMTIQGVACIGLAFSGANYVMYSVFMFLMRLVLPGIMMGGFFLCANWFMATRGRALGFVTIGTPLCTATYVSLMFSFIFGNFGWKYSYLVYGILILVVVILSVLFLHDRPEDVGLFPDGFSEAPPFEDHVDLWTPKKLFSMKQTYCYIVIFGIQQGIITACAGYYAVRMGSLGYSSDVFLQGLSIGAICGIPVSFLIGWLDDKIGSIKALLVLDILFLLAPAALFFMTPTSNSLIFVFSAGLAVMLGGCPTMMPSVTQYLFGRKNYPMANQFLIPICAIPLALATYFMAAMNSIGALKYAYLIMMGCIVLCIVCTLLMWNIPDAQADMRYGNRKAAAEK